MQQSAQITLGARFALALALIVISWLALTPSSPPMPGQTDKLAHLAAFLLLALLADRAFVRRGFDYLVILPLIAYGGALELIQGMLPYRFGSWADLAADAAGVLLYGVFFRRMTDKMLRGLLRD